MQRLLFRNSLQLLLINRQAPDCEAIESSSFYKDKGFVTSCQLLADLRTEYLLASFYYGRRTGRSRGNLSATNLHGLAQLSSKVFPVKALCESAQESSIELVLHPRLEHWS